MSPQEIRSMAYKTAAKFALLMGGYLVVRFAAEINTSSYPLLSVVYIALTIGIPFFAYFLGKKFVKQTQKALPQDQESTGAVVGFGDFYSYTFFLFVFASLILCVGQYVFYQYLSPQYIQAMYDVSIANIDKVLLQYPALSAYKDMLLESPTPSSLQMATQSIWLYSIAGIIIGLINAAIYRFFSKKHIN